MPLDSPLAEAAPARGTRRARRATSAPEPLSEQTRADDVETALPEPPLTRRRLRELASATPAPEIIHDGDADFGEALKVAEQVATTAPETGVIPLPEEDEFLAAARALHFTGETAVIPPAPAGMPEAAPATEHVAPRRGRAFRRVATTAASLGAMGVIALLAVGMTTPLGAVAQGDAAAATVSIAAGDDQDLADEEIQAYVASSDVQNADVSRSQAYTAETFASLASADGISTSGAFFVNDPTADSQWPFAVGTSMSSGYGMRWGRLHEGIDFTPGDGAPVQAIADGVVRIATESGGAYGVTVYIDHVIDGQVVTSHYAHMQYGSLQVVQGQRVEVGDVVGLTGNTGRSYGAHMHFEVIINGSTTDPLPWLQEHANTRYSDDEETEATAAIDELLGSEITSD